MSKRERKRLTPEQLANLKLEKEDMPPDVMARVVKATAQADAEDFELRVNFRWDKQSLDLVKAAAKVMGNIPYQTYLKQAVIRQAMSDLCKVQGMPSHLVSYPSQQGGVAEPQAAIPYLTPKDEDVDE